MRFCQPVTRQLATRQLATRNKAMLAVLLLLAACATDPVEPETSVDTSNMAFIPSGWFLMGAPEGATTVGALTGDALRVGNGDGASLAIQTPGWYA